MNLHIILAQGSYYSCLYCSNFSRVSEHKALYSLKFSTSYANPLLELKIPYVEHSQFILLCLFKFLFPDWTQTDQSDYVDFSRVPTRNIHAPIKTLLDVDREKEELGIENAEVQLK